MKVRIELNIVEDHGVWLNFWDSNHGNDVVAKVVNGRLAVEGKRISLAEFIRRVEAEATKE